MVKAAGKGNLRNTGLRIQQKPAAHFQPVPIEKFHGRLLQVFPKNHTAFASADIGGRGYLGERQILLIVFINIRNHSFLQILIV